MNTFFKIQLQNLNLLDFVILKLCYIILFIDSLTGFFLNQGISLPISSLYKFIMIGLMMLRILAFRRPSPFLYICYVTTLFLYYALYDNTIFGVTFSFISRYLIILVLYEYLRLIAKRTDISLTLYKIIRFNFIILIGNILLGLIGIGHTTYNEFGSKGFFYAGNEVAGVLMTIAPIVLYITIKKYTIKSYKFLTLIFACLVSSILLGTKSGLLGIFVIIFYIIWNYAKIKRTYIILFTTTVIGGAAYYIYNHFAFMYNRFLYSFNDRGMGWMALLSNRDIYYEEIMPDFYNANFVNSILGLGMPYKTIEIDFFDFLYISGYLGVLILIIFWIISIRNCQGKDEISSVIRFTNYLLIGVSFIAGHIYSSAMAGPFIAIINILPLIKNQFTKTLKI